MSYCTNIKRKEQESAPRGRFRNTECKEQATTKTAAVLEGISRQPKVYFSHLALGGVVAKTFLHQ